MSLRTAPGTTRGRAFAAHRATGGVEQSLQKDLDRLNELWQEGLDRFGGPFLTGSEFTAVDAFFCPIAFRAQTYNLSLNSSYIQQLLSLKSM